MKSDRMLYTIYTDLECFIEETEGRENNPEKSSTTKIGERISC